MNIKRFVSHDVRRKLLLAFSWVPDSIMLRFQYWLILHRWPNFKNPKGLNEKLQLYKFKYRNELMPGCVDKYTVREFVEKKLGGTAYLNELYQVCHTADEIDFDALPQQFVIKTTDGGNGDNVLVVRDKSKLNITEAIKKVNSWRNKKYYKYSREWAYIGAKESRIIVEKFLDDPNNSDGSIDDYKFLCYNGKFRYLWVDKNRYSKHQRAWWNENLQYLKGQKSTYDACDEEPTLPLNINEMIRVAEKLSEDFPFARIDLYNIKGDIIFGEITFYPGSGYMLLPKDFDEELGKYFDYKFE